MIRKNDDFLQVAMAGGCVRIFTLVHWLLYFWPHPLEQKMKFVMAFKESSSSLWPLTNARTNLALFPPPLLPTGLLCSYLEIPSPHICARSSQALAVQ